MVLRRNQKGFLSPVYKHLKKKCICSFFQNKPVQGINEEIEEIHCINDKGKLAKNEWENDDSNFLGALYSVCKKLGQFFFHTSH